jgi:uncharacterized protein (TIGR03067 family)
MLPRRILFLGLLSVLAVPATRGDEPDPEPVPRPEAVLKKMRGTWNVVSLTDNGIEVRKTLAVDRVTITGDRLLFQSRTRHEEHTIRLDTRKRPPHLDFPVANQPRRSARGLYKLDRNSLVIVFAGAGEPRPANFTGKSGMKLVLRRP